MFFFGIMGIGSKAKPAGMAAAACPLCGRQVQMSIACSYSYFHFFFIPLFRFGVQYYATCPGCAGVFALEKRLGDCIKKGQPITLTAADLRPVKPNQPNLCPACGHRNPAGSAFCNRCGHPL